MDGQMSLEDFLPRKKPDIPEPAVYSESGNQYIKAEKNGRKLEISICTYSEMMIIRVDAKEFEEYMKGVINGGKSR